MQIRIGSGSGISWQKIVKFKIWKFNIFFSRPPWRTSKLQEKLLAIKREHPALQNIQIFLFGFFLPFWIRIQLTINADPQHCRQDNGFCTRWCRLLPIIIIAGYYGGEEGDLLSMPTKEHGLLLLWSLLVDLLKKSSPVVFHEGLSCRQRI